MALDREPGPKNHEKPELPPVLLLNCQECKLHKDRSFCNLPRQALIELDRIKHTRAFAAGDRLFNEGKPVDELMIVCQGCATLTLSSSTGKALVLGVSEAGEVLGLSSAISGRQHEVSAEAIEKTTVAVIERSDFLKFLERFPPAALNAGAELSRKVNRAYEKIRLVGAGLSVVQRLAAWLLSLQENYSVREDLVTVALTHEQIAQILGVSRESVTRALSDLKKRKIVEVRGIHVYVRDRQRLHSIVFASG
ncbi:MAG: Crp/Fnr family transcriptional regulator [Acidobacteriaceae bacterium]|nr:Crp/Fnr family transcriptional regulator [Acidobacteriaceae bacterium]MBV9778517.1 Crp/Fnr family transcriptional regulator [Acidobacteriaceae bacterium]